MSEEEYSIPVNPYVKVDSRDPNFNQWFLENKDGISSLKMLWQGWVKDSTGNWYKPHDSEVRRIMNDKGIHWSIQIMESYLDKTFLSTNWDREEMCYVMRKAVRVVYLGLMYQYAEFGINKINVQVIANEILARIHAILLAARGGGIRTYLSSSQSIQELRQSTPNDNRGFFSGVSGLFNRNRNGG
jgi:hypothetical protein